MPGVDLACVCGGYEVGEPVVAGRARNGDLVDIRTCTACGIARTYPPPSVPGLIDGLYASESGFADQQAHLERFRGYARAILDRAAKNGRPSGHLLDVGCGIGALLLEAQSRGYEVHGLEINPLAVAYAREQFHLDVRAGAVESAANFEYPFDVITLSQVLEHLERPAESLARLASFLSPGGIIVVESPNMNGLWPRVLGALWYPYQVTQHLWHYTPRAMPIMAERAGLRLVDVAARRCIDYGLPPRLGFLTDWPGTLFGAGDNVMAVFKRPGA